MNFLTQNFPKSAILLDGHDYCESDEGHEAIDACLDCLAPKAHCCDQYNDAETELAGQEAAAVCITETGVCADKCPAAVLDCTEFQDEFMREICNPPEE